MLHDGPPTPTVTSTSATHSKILKIYRAIAHDGLLDAPYVPGWDCHGLPIELNVDRELGSKKRDLSVAGLPPDRFTAAGFVDAARGVLRLVQGTGRIRTDDALSYQAATRALEARIKGMVYAQEAGALVHPLPHCARRRSGIRTARILVDLRRVSPRPMPADLTAGSIAARRPRRQRIRLIWTTTPWTIPDPALASIRIYTEPMPWTIGSSSWQPPARRRCRPRQDLRGRPIARFPGRTLEGIRFRHPLYAIGRRAGGLRDAGPGHRRRSHGSRSRTDDFNTGIRYGLEIYAPVGPGGHFLESVELFGGMRVFDANPHVEAALDERGRLWRRESFAHSYPHCWRCHNPVIFLATSQWFISMVEGGLRAAALREIEKVTWIPGWGEERMGKTVEFRPDWCISRQRSWGVPIPP